MDSDKRRLKPASSPAQQQTPAKKRKKVDTSKQRSADAAILRDPQLFARIVETQTFRPVITAVCTIVNPNHSHCVLTTAQATALIGEGVNHHLSDNGAFLYVAIPVSDAQGELANLTEGV